MFMISMKRCLSCQLLVAACVLADSTVAIDNEQVKVIKAYELPRVRTPMHEHKFNRVIIYETAGTQQFIDMHKKPYALTFSAGDVKWSKAGGMHTAEIFSQNPVPIVEIEIKRPGSPSFVLDSMRDPVKVDPKHYKVEFENDQVRVLRVTIGPHESTPVHEHSVNRVVTYLTDQDFRVTSLDGKVEHTKHSVGEVSWAGPATHKEENLSDKPFEVIVTEVKN
jgi:quercetin dioxygenase-like cupin family protein